MRSAVEDRRLALGLTPGEFSDRAGLTPEGLAKVRRGERRRYQEKTTRGVARALHWPMDWYPRLLAGEDPSGWQAEIGQPLMPIDEVSQLRSEVAGLAQQVAALRQLIEERVRRPSK